MSRLGRRPEFSTGPAWSRTGPIFPGIDHSLIVGPFRQPCGVYQDRTDRRSRGVGSEHFERASDNGCRDAIRDTTAVSA